MSIPSLSLKSQVSSLKFKDALSASLKPNFRLQTSNLRLRKSKGLSLVELVVFIVIVSTAVAGVLGVMDVTTRSSVDPMIHKQALAIAEAVLEEVQLQPFTYCDPDDPGAATADLAGAGVPIAFDAASSCTPVSTAANSVTWSHTTSGADRILIVGVSIRNDLSQTVSGVTYAGTPLTPVPGGVQDNGTSVRVELWRLVAPALGANNVVVTLSGGATAKMACGAVSLTGVGQANPIDATNSAIGTSATPSVTVTTVADNAWVVDAIAFRSTGNALPTGTAGSGQTQRWSGYTESGGILVNIRGMGSTEGPKSPAGAVVMDWALSASADWAAVGVAPKPGGGCGTLAEAIGPEAGETRYSSTVPFDNVNDYHGFDSNTGALGIRNIDNTPIVGLDGYRVTVSVAGQPLGPTGAIIGNDANGNPQSLLVSVTVTGPGNTTVTLHGYRTRYAPNDLP